MPNLRGASPVGRDDGDCSYVAQTVGTNVTKSAVSRRADGVSRIEVVVLREYRAAKRGVDCRTPSGRDSGHKLDISRVSAWMQSWWEQRGGAWLQWN